jgi:hypothetical protein
VFWSHADGISWRDGLLMDSVAGQAERLPVERFFVATPAQSDEWPMSISQKPQNWDQQGLKTKL